MHDMSWPQQNLTAAVAIAIALPSYLVPRLESISEYVLFLQECAFNKMTDDYFLTFYLLYKQVKYALTPILPGSQISQ